jgi:hypothetical protein
MTAVCVILDPNLTNIIQYIQKMSHVFRSALCMIASVPEAESFQVLIEKSHGERDSFALQLRRESFAIGLVPEEDEIKEHAFIEFVTASS